MNWFEKYKVDVPEGEMGEWRINKFTITPEIEKHNRLRSLMSYQCGRYVPQGSYTRLLHGDDCVMSDTPDEIRDHLDPLQNASGRCLVNGLGLGMCANGMLMRPEVEHVTVIEYSPEVINLVAEHWKRKWGDKIEIVHADALEWRPPKGVRYGYVWHDIWTDITIDNVPTISKLNRRYGRLADRQSYWAKPIIESQKRAERRSSYSWY